MAIDWTKLQAVHDAAGRASVSWALHYGEADDSFYFVVSSAAPSENQITKDRSFDFAVLDVLDWLQKLIA